MKRGREKASEESPSPVNQNKKLSFREKGETSKMDETTFRKIIGEELDKKLAKFDKIVPIVEHNSKLIEQLTKRVSLLEQNSKKLNIILHGIPESTGRESLQNRINIFTDIVQKLGLKDIDCEDIRRLGLSNPSKVRPLLVKLVKMTDKIEIMKSRKMLKGTKVFIEDDLNIEERKLNARLREKFKDLRKDDPTITGFVRNGSICMWKQGQKTVLKFSGESSQLEPVQFKTKQ